MDEMIAVPMTIMRGGTSKAVFFMEKDIPAEMEDKRKFLLAAFGSPDKRQIDGLGGADPLTSKCAVIGPPTKEGADIDYTFYQIGIGTPTIEVALCGNISAAVGGYAIDKGLVRAVEPVTLVQAYNPYLDRIIGIEVQTRNGKPLVEGDFQIDGVPGSGAKVFLDLKNAGGGSTGALLPTGNIRDTLHVEGVGDITTSIVDFGNPVMFIKAEDVGLKGTELPAEVDPDAALVAKLEAVRAAGAEAAGLISHRSKFEEEGNQHPLLLIVSAPTTYKTFTNQTVEAKDIDIVSRAMCVGTMHKAFPGSGAFCIGVTAKMEGSVVYDYMSRETLARKTFVIGHPGGLMDVDTEVEKVGNRFKVHGARLARTARKILDGVVYLKRSSL